MGDFDDFDDDFELSIKLAPADWRKWFFIKEPNIREAIILALGLDPDDENISKCNNSDFDNWARCVRWKFLAYGSKEIDKYFKILADIASREFVSPETDYCGDDFYYGDKVNIHVFAEWVQPILEKMGLTLPPEFPIEQLKTEQGVNENVTKPPDEQAIKGQSTKESEVSAQCQQELIKAYKLIGLLLKYIATGKQNFTQDWLAGELEKDKVYGLGKTNINTLFSNGKKALEKQ